jgi:hypothetical protein
LFFCPQPNFQVNSDFLSARKMASRSSLTMWNVLSFILFSVGVAPALLISNFFCSRDYTSCHHVIFVSLFQTPRSCQINCRWWKYRNKKRMLCYSAHSRYYLTSRSIPCEAISIALLYSTYCGWCKPVDQTSTRLKIVAEKSNKKTPSSSSSLPDGRGGGFAMGGMVFINQVACVYHPTLSLLFKMFRFHPAYLT